MEAKELMIGDFVRSKLHDVVTTITDIEGGDKYDNPAVWLKDKSCWERHYLYEIEPIPLTEEILQKNFPDPDVITWFPLDEKPGYFNIYWEHPVFGEGELRLDIRYVHELQHILTMLNIDREITL